MEQTGPTKRNTLLATGQVPDLMKASPVDVRDFAGPKILTPIMPLVEQYAPNLKRYMEAYPNWSGGKLTACSTTCLKSTSTGPSMPR